jgi:NarL family two-component system response regulator LiaR
MTMFTKPPRVLLVDDEAPSRQLLAQALSEEGIAVVGQAGTGDEGVEIARTLNPEVVLMDLRMPDGSGIEAARRIKKDRPHTQVLLLTAYEGELPSRSAYAVGAYAYLIKGCSVSLIRDMVMTAAALCRALKQGAAKQLTAAPGGD